MVIELLLVGIFVGAISGFFGVGGGMLLTPLLFTLGFDFKTAIGISIVQMVFSSVYGSYLNYKKGSLVIGEGMFIGFGGFVGGFVGGTITQGISEGTLQYMFLGLVVFAVLRILFSKSVTEDCEVGRPNKWLLFVIGIAIGVIAILLGVGGSILLLPILIGFLHYPIKKAVSAGLFFVVFSSIAGLSSRLSTGTIDMQNGLVVASAALIGVIFGIWLKDHIKDTHHKASLVVLYLFIIVLMVQKMFL